MDRERCTAREILIRWYREFDLSPAVRAWESVLRITPVDSGGPCRGAREARAAQGTNISRKEMTGVDDAIRFLRFQVFHRSHGNIVPTVERASPHRAIGGIAARQTDGNGCIGSHRGQQETS